MTPERWRIAEDLFHQAAALQGSEQRERLARVPPHDRSGDWGGRFRRVYRNRRACILYEDRNAQTPPGTVWR
jgi:hypothetical protein